MKIEYSREKLTSLFTKGKEKIVSIAIVILSLIIAISTYRSQTRNLELLNIEKDIEIKKNALLNEIKQSEKKIEFYKNLLNEKDPTLITNKINDIARDSNVRIISVTPGTQEQQPLYIKYSLTISIGADSYHAIGKFISKIESYSDVYFVNTISIKSSKEDQAGQILQSTDKLIVNLILNIIAFTS